MRYSHERFNTTYCTAPIDCEKPFFVVSRNPFDHIMSAYLDKIHPDGSPGVWLEFCRDHGIDPLSQPSFDEFLELLIARGPSHRLNPHFRPQYLVNNCKFISPHFEGRMEYFDDIAQFLSDYNFKIIVRRIHATNAPSKRDELTAKQIKLIQQIYKDDFEHYGYEKNPNRKFAPPSITRSQFVASALKNFGKIRGRIDQKKILPVAELALHNNNTAKCASLLGYIEMLGGVRMTYLQRHNLLEAPLNWQGPEQVSALSPSQLLHEANNLPWSIVMKNQLNKLKRKIGR